jgi:predicted lipoprotein with Yx(FWY)xxD motif
MVMKKVLAAAVVVLMSASAFAAEPPWSPVEVSTVEDGKGGYKFTNDKGMPFYVNSKDNKTQVGCGEDCTGLTWLPVWARNRSEPKGDWTIVIRPDMSKQWAWKGVPIYQYNGDADELEDALKADKSWKVLVE